MFLQGCRLSKEGGGTCTLVSGHPDLHNINNGANFAAKDSAHSLSWTQLLIEEEWTLVYRLDSDLEAMTTKKILSLTNTDSEEASSRVRHESVGRPFEL